MGDGGDGGACPLRPPWFLIVKYIFLIHLDMFWLGGSVYNIYRCAFFNIFGEFTDGGQDGLF